MSEPTALPLATNHNKSNICEPYESTENSFDRGFPFPEGSSITKLLTDLENLTVTDENTNPLHVAAGNNALQRRDDVDILKAELEATRRKLAEYEARSNVGSQPNVPNNDSSSANPYSCSPARNLPRNETGWPEQHSSAPNALPAPRPPLQPFPNSTPALRNPASASPFQIPNSDPNVISCNPNLISAHD